MSGSAQRLTASRKALSAEHRAVIHKRKSVHRQRDARPIRRAAARL